MLNNLNLKISKQVNKLMAYFFGPESSFELDSPDAVRSLS